MELLSSARSNTPGTKLGRHDARLPHRRYNMIQKLLFSEYNDFDEVVLLESPFVETTREGRGIKQLQIAVTRTKLITAMDIIQPATDINVWYTGIDPEIENLELISVLPIECVNLSVFHRHKRHTLKAHFCNESKRYFELGGTQNRKIFWSLWCEQVKFLSSLHSCSSKSETTAASSSSNSTLYLTASHLRVPEKGQHQLWCYYGTKSKNCLPDNFLSKQTNTSSSNTNAMVSQHSSSLSSGLKTLYRNSKISTSKSSLENLCRNNAESRLHIISRFGEGIPENCRASLCFLEEKPTAEQKLNQRIMDNPFCDLEEELLEDALKIWEQRSAQKLKHRRHPRRYGLCPQALFLYGLGPWNVSPGERSSLQAKRAISAVRIWRQPVDEDIRLPILRRQLLASLSCDTLINMQQGFNKFHFKNKLCSPCLPIIYFWTPEYWYRPKTAPEAYKELHKHLMKLNTYLEQTKKPASFSDEVTSRKSKAHTVTSLSMQRYQEEEKRDDDETHVSSRYSSSTNIIWHVLSRKREKRKRMKAAKKCKQEGECSSLDHIKKILKRDLIMTAWDFDANTLAQQITLIDRALFLKIPASELHIALWQQSSKNAPNTAALIAFAHRISCLIATQILQESLLKARVELMIRFINTADKCNSMNNFQSCRSILAGLQSPGIYRLHNTWACLRRRRASKYHIFEKLCRLYQNVHLPRYPCTFMKETSQLPYLPFIGDIFSCLLGRSEKVFEGSLSKTVAANNVSDSKENCRTSSEDYSGSSGFQHFLSFLNFWSGRSNRETEISPRISMSNTENDIKCWPQLHIDSSLLVSKDHKCQDKCYCGENHTTCSDKVLSNFDSLFVPLESNEDLRIQRLKEATALLHRCQQTAARFSFCTNELAQDFLLKAHYKEEKENFYISFRLE